MSVDRTRDTEIMGSYTDFLSPFRSPLAFDPANEHDLNLNDNIPSSEVQAFLEDWNFKDANNSNYEHALQNDKVRQSQEQGQAQASKNPSASRANSLFDDLSPKTIAPLAAMEKVSPKPAAARPSTRKQKPELRIALPPSQPQGQAVRGETAPETTMGLKAAAIGLDTAFDQIAADFLGPDEVTVDPAPDAPLHIAAPPIDPALIDPALMDMYNAQVPQVAQVPATHSHDMLQGTVNDGHYNNNNNNNVINSNNHDDNTGTNDLTSLGIGLGLGWNDNSPVIAGDDVTRYPTPANNTLSAWTAPSLPVASARPYMQPMQQLYTPPASHAPSRAPTPLPNSSGYKAPATRIPERIPRQRKQCQSLDFSQWYEPLPAAPPSWGGKDPFRPKFTYTRHGEWAPSLRLSRDDVLEYMATRKRTGQPLRIWIQNMPAGCNNRHPSEASRRCRWASCPAKGGTILKGWWRVAFDERPATSGSVHDPFHNAGYMHLFCFEACFDLVEVAAAFDVRPDTRHLPKEERNPMALTRDHGDLLVDWERWRAEQTAKHAEWARRQAERKARGVTGGQGRERRREDHLWYVLTTAHMAKESAARQAVRDRRGGLSLDKHKGDLAMYCRMKAEAYKRTRREQEEARKLLAQHKRTTRMTTQEARSPRVNRRKRSREDEDGEWTPTTPSRHRRGGEEGQVQPTSPTQRAAKRHKRGASLVLDEVVVIPDPESPRRSPRLSGRYPSSS